MFGLVLKVCLGQVRLSLVSFRSVWLVLIYFGWFWFGVVGFHLSKPSFSSDTSSAHLRKYDVSGFGFGWEWDGFSWVQVRVQLKLRISLRLIKIWPLDSTPS